MASSASREPGRTASAWLNAARAASLRPAADSAKPRDIATEKASALRPAASAVEALARAGHPGIDRKRLAIALLGGRDAPGLLVAQRAIHERERLLDPAGAREPRGGRRMVGLDRERKLERLARGARLRACERLLAALARRLPAPWAALPRAAASRFDAASHAAVAAG